jgi:hypothetical protein
MALHILQSLKLTVRETKLIEKIAIHKQKGYISDMMAVMFKADHLPTQSTIQRLTLS